MLRFKPQLLVVIISVTVLPVQAWAGSDDLSSETSLGAGSQSEALTFESQREEPWAWHLGYTFSHLKENFSGFEVSDTTHEVTGGFDWEKDWLFGAGFSFATTPSEHVKSVGPVFDFGYTWKLGVGFRESVAFLSYKQSFTSTTRPPPGRPARAATVDEQILQTGWTTELDASPAVWISLKGIYTHYFYNRNVNQFLQNLNTPRAVSLGVSGFSNTLEGFQTHYESIQITFYPSELWEFSAGSDLAKSASDGSYTHGFSVSAAKQWGSYWKTGLGYEYANSPSLVQSLADVMITYYF